MMKKTVLITGTSSGIGKSAVKLFQSKGWKVIATMRKPELETELTQLENVFVEKLDVTNQESIDIAISKGIERFGKIDVLINNAGFGMMGVLEGSSEDLMKRMFDVNVFGVVRTTKAILPHFRANKSGLIINVSSIVGRACFPFQALYHASKHAVEGLTEDSQYELKPLGIQVKLVEPGGVSTEFMNTIEMVGDAGIEDYKPAMNGYLTKIQEMLENLSTSESIAEVIYQATTDNSDQLRYLAGADAVQIMGARKQMNDKDFYEMMSSQLGL